MPTTDPKLSVHEGGAGFALSWEEPDADLVNSIPGASEAHDAWQAANARGKLMIDSRTAALRTLAALETAHAPTAEIDEAADAFRLAQRAVDANRAPAMDALREFVRIVRDGYTEDPAVKRAAAHRAIDAHERAVDAQSALFAALAERDRHWRNAGRPGWDWSDRSRFNRSHLTAAKDATAGAVTSFDVDAITCTAEGDPVDPIDARLLGITVEKAAS